MSERDNAISTLDHPNSSDLGRFLDGTLCAEARRRIVRHLLSGCDACRTTIGGIWKASEGNLPRRRFSAPLGAYAGAFDKALRAVRSQRASFEMERQEAPRRIAEFLALSPPERERRLRQDPQLTTPAAIDQLLRESSARTDEALALAESAVELAQRIDRLRYGKTTPRDVESRAWCQLAEIKRERGDLFGSERALDLAESLFDQGSEDPLDRAILDRARARWFARAGRARAAALCFAESVAALRRLGNRETLGITLLELGPSLAESGDAESGIDALLDGIKLLSAARFPHRIKVGLCTLAGLLVAQGREREARPHLWRARALAERLGDGDALERLTWIESRAALAAGRVEVGETSLLSVRDRLSARGLSREALAANFDLAALYLRSGRSVDLTRITLDPTKKPANDAGPARLSSGDLAAVLFLRSAVERGGATPECARDLSDWLAARAAREAAGAC